MYALRWSSNKRVTYSRLLGSLISLRIWLKYAHVLHFPVTALYSLTDTYLNAQKCLSVFDYTTTILWLVTYGKQVSQTFPNFSLVTKLIASTLSSLSKI